MKFTKKVKKGLLLSFLACVLLGGVWIVPKVYAYLNIGTSFVAHQMCSCIYVAKRDYESCLPDLPETLSGIKSEIILSDDVSRVRAWLPIVTEKTAIFRAGYGCMVE
jgi:hypothetical protein